MPMGPRNTRRKQPTKGELRKFRQAEAAAWAMMLQESVAAIKIMTQEMLEVVGQLNQHSARHAMQIRTLKKRWMKQLEINKDLEKRIYTLEMNRSRFDGV